MDKVTDEYGQVKYERVIDSDTGRVMGWMASRINFTQNCYEIGLSYLHPEDKYDRELGKKLAKQYLEKGPSANSFRPHYAKFTSNELLSLTQGFPDNATYVVPIRCLNFRAYQARANYFLRGAFPEYI